MYRKYIHSFLGLFIIAGLLSLSATAKKQKIDYLIFGKYCGMCKGHCSTMYRVDGKSLNVDSSGNFLRYNGVIEYSGKGVKGKKYRTASTLIKKVPALLLNEKLSETTYGCPDCVDQCGYYVEFKKGGKVHGFRLDTNTSGFDKDLAAFVSEIEKTMLQIK